MALFFRNLTIFSNARPVLGNIAREEVISFLFVHINNDKLKEAVQIKKDATSNIYTFFNFLLSWHRLFQPQIAGLKSVDDKLKEANIPLRPKKPISPYFRFVQEQREKILKTNPNLKVTDIALRCAKLWKETEPSAKEQYEKDYKTEMDEYSKKILQYESSLTKEQKNFIQAINREVRMKRKKRELNKLFRENNKPKRPYGSYLFYLMEQSKLLNKSIKDLLPLMKGKWAELPEEEKAKYYELARKAKNEYEEEMAKWEKQMMNEGKTEIVRNKTLHINKHKLQGGKKE